MKSLRNFKDMYLINSSRFASKFTKYGLYSESEFDDLVYNQNYIPIASVDEMDAVRTGTTKEMGVGTKYEGFYTTGLDKNYVVYQPIDCSAFGEFTILGNATTNYTGVFDGNNIWISSLNTGGNHGLYYASGTIRNTKINNIDSVSAFGWLASGGLIEDCESSTTDVKLAVRTAGFCRYSESSTIIRRCNSTVDATAGTIPAGFIIGSAGTIEDCTANITAITARTEGVAGFIRGQEYVGACAITNCEAIFNCTYAGSGVVGGFAYLADNSETFENCKVSGTLNISTSCNNIGGFVGKSTNGTFNKCSSDVSMDVSSGTSVGGFVGNSDTANVSFSECMATGSVIGNLYTGGFAGITRNNSYANCYATGNVTGGNYTGGFIGWNRSATSVENCYSIGVVGGTSNAGGLIGNNSGTVTACYYDTTTSGQSDTGKGEPKTTTEMQEGAIPDTTIYVSWDNTIWDAVDNVSYPELIALQ